MATSDAWRIEREAGGWPLGLEALGDDAPAKVHGAGDRGLVAELAPQGCVTIVGSRRATSAGRELASDLAATAAGAGLVVLSGLAYGIDAAAHRGALDAGGRTVAVMASGPDVVHPPSSRSLARAIRSAGALISEWEAGTPPTRWRFPRRNRLMAALSGLTVVVEAELPSGSMVTADLAVELGREVGAVPGSPRQRSAAGTNELLHRGAIVIRDGRDLLDATVGVGQRTLNRTGPPLEAALRPVLDEATGGRGIDEIAGALGMRVTDAAVALSRLELMGYVEGEPDGTVWRTALEPPPLT